MALRIPAFVCSFAFFLPLFSTSAATLLPLLLLSFSGSCCCCCCYCFLHGWSRAQRSQLVLCERSEKIVAQLLRQLHEYLQAPSQRGSAWRRALQDNSRQFTCTLAGSASSFWASESESEREVGLVTQPCLIMLIYANNQCKTSDNECERERERERGVPEAQIRHTHTHVKQLSRAKTKRYKIHSSRHT